MRDAHCYCWNVVDACSLGVSEASCCCCRHHCHVQHPSISCLQQSTQTIKILYASCIHTNTGRNHKTADCLVLVDKVQQSQQFRQSSSRCPDLIKTERGKLSIYSQDSFYTLMNIAIFSINVETISTSTSQFRVHWRKADLVHTTL